MTEDYILSHPLRTPLAYDPRFKVDIQLDEPLWKVLLSPSDVAIEVLTLCSQLEPLCKRKYTTKSGKITNSHKNEFQNSFEPKARVVLRKMEEYLQFLPSPQPTLEEYLQYSGLAELFPRVMSYIDSPERPIFFAQEYLLEEHFSTFGLLNQLVTLSHQLNYDAFNRSNHKYMAHQLALLYQSINLLGCQELLAQKKEVEGHFKTFKSKLVVKDKKSIPKLPDDEKEW
ncbi:uncharacterized protein LOC114523436 [Dendronephthya gigantea]|nr:uncharacterized protein LOC114523436 [Dendronephthya gigantea]